jgi:hypothetical protein
MLPMLGRITANPTAPATLQPVKVGVLAKRLPQTWAMSFDFGRFFAYLLPRRSHGDGGLFSM